MLTYILRRLALMIPTLIGVTAVVFFIMALAPGGFGGSVLNEQGSQNEGEEARRIREYFNRRYGLDKPAIIQYGHWLNQVSPVGFLTSSQITFTHKQLAEAQTAIDADPLLGGLKDQGRPGHMLSLVRMLAAYENVPPLEATRLLHDAFDNTAVGEALLKKINPEVTIKPSVTSTPKGMQGLFVSELAGRQRILFARPAVKWPDLGQSLRGRRVTQLLGEAVPITLLLNLITLPIIYSVALVTGILAARYRGRAFDIISGFIMLGLWCLPVIWVGVMLIGYLANKQYWKLFPTDGLHALEADAMRFLPFFGPDGFERGWLLDAAWHLALPVLCLTYGGFAVLSKLTRGSILDNISCDYVRTVRAKGVSEQTVLFRHVLRNSLLPLITVSASILPALFIGSVVVENIFSIPGMGKLGVEAAFMKDREVVMGTTLLGGLLGLASELLRDICYAAADPRVSYE